MAQKIIDTHIHIWQLDQSSYQWLQGNTSILNRNYDLQELEPERKAAGITNGILVQADITREDTEWMLKAAANTDWIDGVVCWLPLKNPEATAKFVEERSPYFKGVRHLIHDEADPRWLLQDTVLESLSLLAKHNIPYDVVGVLPEHIETVLQVARKVPGLRMIFDHLNQPPVAAKEKFGKWGTLMQEAALNPNFYAKISGLGTTAGKDSWNAGDLQPYIEFILKHFGEDRCCCGGDWPVSLLAGSYTYTWSQYKEVFNRSLNEEGREKLYHINAERFYNL